MDKRKKLYIIINPGSGTHSKDSIPAMIAGILDKSKWQVTVRVLEHNMLMSQLVSEAIADGYHGVVAVGGDGTVNGIAASLRDTGIALGIVPCGSGNGLARHLQIPVNIEKSLRIINDGHIESFDYCTVNDQPFSALAAWGSTLRWPSAFARGHTRPAHLPQVGFHGIRQVSP